MQHEEWRGLKNSVVIIPESTLTTENITQITACLEQLDIRVDHLAQKTNQDEYVLGNFCEGLVSMSVRDCSLESG